MTAPVMINENPYCDVDLHSLEASGLKDKFVVRLADPETGEMVPINTKGAIHSTGYRLIPNSRVNQITQDVLTRTKMKWEPLPKFGNSKVSDQVWDGKKFAARYYMPDVNVDISDPSGSNTKLTLGVEAVNSYDGSYGVALQFFIMSMACSNQFRSNNLLGGFNFRHHEGEGMSLDTDIEDASELLMDQADRFKDIAPMIQHLTNTTLGEAYGVKDPMDAFLHLRKDLSSAWRPGHDTHLLDELNNKGVTARMNRTQTAHTKNMWGMLNAYTAVATHHIGGFNGTSVNRMVTDHFMNLAGAHE